MAQCEFKNLISSLPIDLLELITFRTPGSALFNLYKTNNKEVQYHLGDLGGIQRLYYEDAYLESDFPFFDYFLPKLIRLVHFESREQSSKNSPISKDSLSKLPHSLQSLSVPMWLEAEKEKEIVKLVKSLPPNLTSLKTSTLDSIPSFIAHLLPRNLTHLNYLVGITYPDVPALPRGLTDLSCKYSKDDEPDSSLFPPALTRLSISSKRVLSKDILLSLPASVTDLTLKIPPVDQKNGKFHSLPPNLTKLSTSLSFLHNEFLQSLPTNLESITFFPKYRENVDVDYNHLPAGLTSLEIRAFIPNRSPTFASLLPSTLTEVALGVLDYYNLALLPSSLLSLEVFMADYRGERIQFPPKLTFLDIYGHGVTRESFYQALPPTLTTLNSYLTDMGCLDAIDVQNLPRGLTSLVITEIDNSQLFAYLPPGLRHLQVYAFTKLCDLDLRFLPSSMKMLVLRHCPDLTDEASKYLPRSLRQLTLFGVARLTPAFMQHLPRSITQLTITTPHVETYAGRVETKDLQHFESLFDARPSVDWWLHSS